VLFISVVSVALLALAKLDLFTSPTSSAAGQVPYTITSNYAETSSSSRSRLLDHINRVLVGCGEVCQHDVERPRLRSSVLPTLAKKVDCHSLLTNAAIDASRPSNEPTPRVIPSELQHHYTYGGKVGVKDWFFDSPSYSGGKARMAVWTKEQVEDWKEKCSRGDLKGTYTKSVTKVRRAESPETKGFHFECDWDLKWGEEEPHILSPSSISSWYHSRRCTVDCR